MWQFLGLVLLFFLFMYAFYAAVILLIIAGLIFRTKETLGLLVLGAIISHPLIGGGVFVLLLLVNQYLKRKAAKQEDETIIDALPSPDD